MSGPTEICDGGVAVYSATVPTQQAWAISNYNWTVPAGATILSGGTSQTIRVKFGANSGNVSVTATTPCGTTAATTRAVTIGAPVFQALMITNSSSLTTGEQAIRTNLQGRGYTVIVREDQDFDTLDAFCKNIIILSATIDASVMSARELAILKEQSAGMVVMNPNLFDDLGLSAGVGTTASQTQINLTGNARRITSWLC